MNQKLNKCGYSRLFNFLIYLDLLFRKMSTYTIKVIIHKSRDEVSLVEQDKIDYDFFSQFKVYIQIFKQKFMV
jgi:hypothetical protein